MKIYTVRTVWHWLKWNENLHCQNSVTLIKMQKKYTTLLEQCDMDVYGISNASLL